MKKLIKKGVNLLKKPKRLWIHLAIFGMMALSFYLSVPHILILRIEWIRMMVAMIIGAYIHKPLSDWICEKILNNE